MNLKPIFELLNGAHVAKECFQKSRAWLHQRLYGSIVNGKPAELTKDQKKQLATYFKEKANELIEIAEHLEK